jgi:hypothetical protein
MSRVTGQILRTIGLLIELLGFMGVMTGRDDIAALRLRLPNGTELSPAWIAFAVGFVIWMIGTVVVFKSQRTKPPSKPRDDWDSTDV